MPLPDFNDLKRYLKKETSAEDELLQDLIEEALAWAETLISRPIVAKQRTIRFVTPVFDEFNRGSLYLRPFPVSATPAPVVTNSSGTVIAEADWTLDGTIGRIWSNDGVSFNEFPYNVVATVGLDAHPDFEDRYSANCRTLIIGLASILYHQRNPSASSESESGASVSYGGEKDEETGLPVHLASIVKRLRPRRI
jgi:hypothetical protein